MKFVITADTDIGTSRNINQDSYCYKICSDGKSQMAMAVVCDGMGGLSGGEYSSGILVDNISTWFNTSFFESLKTYGVDSSEVIGKNLKYLTQTVSQTDFQIKEHSERSGTSSGTTMSLLLMNESDMLLFHVGDSRIYRITDKIEQLSTDHSVVEREYRLGNITLKEKETDSRRNILTQCIGASSGITPQVDLVRSKKGVYLLCSDGFRHKNSDEEILNRLSPAKLHNRQEMKAALRSLIDKAMLEGEGDNITAVLLKAE